MKALRILGIGMASGLLIVLISSWVIAGRLVEPQRHLIGPAPSDLPAKAISIYSQSGSRLAGWHVPATPSKGVVVLLHGIRGSRLSMLGRARFLHGAGFSVVMIDFQAHGESPGAQITAGHLEKHDARAAIGFAKTRHPGEPVAIIGVSLGAAAAILATPLNIDALVVESAYPDIRNAIHNRVSIRLGPVSWLPSELLLAQLKPRLGIPRSALRPVVNISGVGVPLLLVSGGEDRHTTVSDTRQLFDAAAQPKELWIVEGAGHVDLHAVEPVEYEARILDFFWRHMRKVPPGNAG